MNEGRIRGGLGGRRMSRVVDVMLPQWFPRSLAGYNLHHVNWGDSHGRS